MSSIAAYRGNDGIVFAADGAMYDMNGVVKGFVSKLSDLPNGDGICGSVGIYGFLDAFVSLLDGPFDSIVDDLVDLGRQAYRDIASQWPAAGIAPRATLIIGGWSVARSQYELYKLHSSEKPFIDAETGLEAMSPPWTVIPVPNMWASSAPKEEHLAAFGIDYENDKNTIEMTARIVCANRAASEAGDHDGVYGVGGFLEMAVIYSQGILRWTAHEWPDEIGQVIDPNVGDPMPVFPLEIPWPK